jgi:hypothetical protein
MSSVLALLSGIVVGIFLTYFIYEVSTDGNLRNIIKKYKFYLGIWVTILVYLLNWGPLSEYLYEFIIFCFGTAAIFGTYIFYRAVTRGLGGPN